MVGEERECSYIMANALCPCAVSTDSWCIAQQSRANGQMKQGRVEGWRWDEGCGETWDEGTSHTSVKEGMTKER